MHFLVKERGRIYERRNEDSNRTFKKEERERYIMVWQEEWDEMRRVAQWTKSLIPNLRRWMDCVHRRLDYFLTQMLTRHGCFRGYLYRFGKAENDKCLYCKISDTVSDTLLVCERWIDERSLLERELGSRVQSVTELVEEMLRSSDRWRAVQRYVRRTLERKEQEERRPEGRQGAHEQAK
ncbi:uncharacterized protein [Diabrotica undecimpunctata]|uniref:uncharacterized protein n=1 Tax=Diabrotica undecimpunctata TaxID=50387 RepID=UPI003B63A2C6